MKCSCAAAILFLGLFSVAVAYTKAPVQCVSQGELLPDPRDCRKFYECSFGVPSLSTCPDGLYFHPTRRQCDYPSEDNCQPARTRTVPTCPENPGDDVVHLPNPDDCSSFYKCNDKNEPVLVPCPPGLEFDPIELVCDWPANANCSVKKH